MIAQTVFFWSSLPRTAIISANHSVFRGVLKTFTEQVASKIVIFQLRTLLGKDLSFTQKSTYSVEIEKITVWWFSAGIKLYIPNILKYYQQNSWNQAELWNYGKILIVYQFEWLDLQQFQVSQKYNVNMIHILLYQTANVLLVRVIYKYKITYFKSESWQFLIIYPYKSLGVLSKF